MSSNLIHLRYPFIKRFFRDAFVIAASIVAAILFVELGIINAFMGDSQLSLALSSFLAGAFFTSLFTLAPSGVALVAISQSFSPFAVAFFGALGAMLVDLAIIWFVRKRVSEDLSAIPSKGFRLHILKAFHFGFLKWVAFGLGIFVIASPLPDEVGLFLIGISKISSNFLPLIFFISHFIGILLVVSIAGTI